MKTIQLARFVMGGAAIFAAFGLAACGAESGAPEAEGVGQTSEALTCNTAVKDLKDAVDTSGMDVNPDPVGREFSASCVISDNGTQKMLVAGGFDSSGNGSGEAFLYNPGAPGSWTKVASLPAGQERGLAKMIQDPSDASACLLVGGVSKKSGGSLLATTYRFTAAAGPAYAWTSKGALNTPRIKFALAKAAGSDKLIVMGGASNAAGSTATAAVETWSGTAWTARTSLPVAVYDFAFASQDSTNDKFLLAGGHFGTTVASAELQILKITTGSPDVYTVTDLTATYSKSLTTGRNRAVAFPVSGSRILVAIGYDTGSSVTTSTQAVDVDFATPTNTVVQTETAAPTNLVAIGAPALVTDGTNFELVGGEDGSGNTSARVQKYTVGAGTPWSNITTCTDRSHHVAEYLTSQSKIYTTTGISNPSGGSLVYLTATDSISP